MSEGNGYFLSTFEYGPLTFCPGAPSSRMTSPSSLTSSTRLRASSGTLTLRLLTSATTFCSRSSSIRMAIMVSPLSSSGSSATRSASRPSAKSTQLAPRPTYPRCSTLSSTSTCPTPSSPNPAAASPSSGRPRSAALPTRARPPSSPSTSPRPQSTSASASRAAAPSTRTTPS